MEEFFTQFLELIKENGGSDYDVFKAGKDFPKRIFTVIGLTQELLELDLKIEKESLRDYYLEYATKIIQEEFITMYTTVATYCRKYNSSISPLEGFDVLEVGKLGYLKESLLLNTEFQTLFSNLEKIEDKLTLFLNHFAFGMLKDIFDSINPNYIYAYSLDIIKQYKVNINDTVDDLLPALNSGFVPEYMLLKSNKIDLNIDTDTLPNLEVNTNYLSWLEQDANTQSLSKILEYIEEYKKSIVFDGGVSDLAIYPSKVSEALTTLENKIKEVLNA